MRSDRRSQCPRPAALLAAVSVAALGTVGCVEHDRDPNPNAGLPPVQVVDTRVDPQVNKPLPPQGGTTGDLPPAFADPALVRQELPEEPRYAQAYAAIGRPRLVVFVNRTVAGELVPVAPAAPAVSRVDVTGGYGDRTAVYLQPGQYDEADARSIDYELIENLLADELSADGRVSMVAPLAARQRLGDAEVRDIQAGRPQMLGEVATRLNADVLVQVTAHPSRQTADGLCIRLVAEAVNTHGGQAIAFAAVDVPPPLTKQTLNDYTRFAARKLMDGMSGSWEAMGTPAQTATGSPPPPPTQMASPSPAEAVPPPAVAVQHVPPAAPPVAEPVPSTPIQSPPVPSTPTGPLLPATATPQPAVPPSSLPPPP